MRHALESFTGKRLILTLLFVGTLAGLGVLIFKIFIMVPRADESSTFFYTSEGSLLQMWNLLRMGMDSPYTHATVLWLINQILTPSVYLQRMVSFVFWGLALWTFYRLMRNTHFDSIGALIGVYMLGLGALGRFTAADGRFYSLLLFLSVVQIQLVANMLRQSSARNVFFFSVQPCWVF